MPIEAILLVELAVGLVFLRSSVGKVLTIRQFAHGIAQLGFRRWAAFPTAIFVIIAESIFAFGYLVGWHIQLVIPASVILLSIFFGVIAVVLKRGSVVNCMCFGASDDEKISWRSLFRSGMLLISAAFLWAQSALGVQWPRLFELSMFELSLSLSTALLLLVFPAWILSVPELSVIIFGCRACNRRGEYLHLYD